MGTGSPCDYISIKQLNARTFITECRRGEGQFQAMDRIFIPEPGDRMIVVSSGRDEDGVEFSSTLVYERQTYSVQQLFPTPPCNPPHARNGGYSEGLSLSLQSKNRNFCMAHPVLLVDDEPQIRRLIKSLLSRLGFNTIEAADGKSALVALHQARGKVSLLLTDVKHGRDERHRVGKGCCSDLPHHSHPLHVRCRSGNATGAGASQRLYCEAIFSRDTHRRCCGRARGPRLALFSRVAARGGIGSRLEPGPDSVAGRSSVLRTRPTRKIGGPTCGNKIVAAHAQSPGRERVVFIMCNARTRRASSSPAGNAPSLPAYAARWTCRHGFGSGYIAYP